jgi:hypothetical protein
MQLRIFAALLLSFGLQGQGIVTIPTNGTTDTATSCSGIFVDGGGLNGNYGNYNNGYLIIDPPGTSPVSLTFSSFSTASSSDYIYVWDGIGTSGTFIGYYYGSSYPTEEVQSLQHQAQSPFASIRTTPAPLAVLYVHGLQPEPLRQRQTSPQPLPVLVTTRHFSL